MLKRVYTYMDPRDDPFQFAQTSDWSSLDTVAFLIHGICKSLDVSMKSVRFAFLDYFSALDSDVQSLYFTNWRYLAVPAPY